MASLYNQPGSVAWGNIAGPVSLSTAQAVSVQGAKGRYAAGVANNDVGDILTIPVIIAAAFLLWYAIHSYE